MYIVQYNILLYYMYCSLYFIIVLYNHLWYRSVFWKRLILKTLPLPLPKFVSKKIRFRFRFQKFFQKKIASASASKFFFKKNLLPLPLPFENFFFKDASASASKFFSP